VAALDLPVPAAPVLEKGMLPQVEDIIAAVKKMV
jgi:pyruvate/2-oxoglutarate/acetoin dehydrogenase E1 component